MKERMIRTVGEGTRLDFTAIRRQLERDAERYYPRRPWMREEDEIIHTVYGRVPHRVIARHLLRSPSQVRRRAAFLGLTGNAGRGGVGPALKKMQQPREFRSKTRRSH
jgi:hypothetical protein